MTAETAATRRMTYRRAENVTVSHPVFLWDGWLVRGGLHLLIGRQGFGKSTFAAFVASRVNIGLPLPGDDGPHRLGVVAMLSLEEPDDRLVARMVAAGADLERVLILGDVADVDDDGRSYLRPWRLPVDCGVLEDFIAEHHVDLVTIDGLGYSVGGDSHNYANVGAALSALAGVAERTGAAIIGLTHPPKGGAEAV